MSYRLDIKDNSLCIQGLYGAYEAIDDGKGGFIVSVIQDTCVNELDAEGEEYLVESGTGVERSGRKSYRIECIY